MLQNLVRSSRETLSVERYLTKIETPTLVFIQRCTCWCAYLTYHHKVGLSIFILMIIHFLLPFWDDGNRFFLIEKRGSIRVSIRNWMIFAIKTKTASTTTAPNKSDVPSFCLSETFWSRTLLFKNKIWIHPWIVPFFF